MTWYKDAVVYQLHVRAFYDSNQDGIGDFRGLTRKLDYLRDLGVTALWLLPFYPSPLKDDGYDIADYRGVHPHYGSLSDFQAFLEESHRHGLRVITEMVLNHCSDQTTWFQKARHADPDDPARDFFVWSDTPEKYSDARVIFHDFEPSNWSWDTVAQAYYWHRFYHHQPDLNFENPEVRSSMTEALDYWLEMGVDGVRLDAVPYLFEREGTSCENLPETHAFLKQLRRHVDAKFDGRMFLAEANQWPEDAVAYFGDGDECHTAFHFPLMPRLFMAVQMEDRYPLIDILEQTPEIPQQCQWFLFLRNHDELTLEMVTDEERDYMYRMYARDPQARLNQGIRRRLAPLLENDRRKIELLNAMLMSLPGTPVIYYGDEIGMGDNIYLGDRDGVRTPMQWSADRNAGFSRANPQRLVLPVIVDHEYHYEAINVETQLGNPHSLLWWMKRLIGVRQQHRTVFGSGSLEFLYPENAKVLAFLRRDADECILVVANLSRHAQFVELNLSSLAGKTPQELFGQTPFPRIGELPYLLTLGPHATYWFLIEQVPDAKRPRPVSSEVPTLNVDGDWSNVFNGPHLRALETALGKFLRHQTWFAGGAKRIQSVSLAERFPVAISDDSVLVWLLILRVAYTNGEHEHYVLPLSFAAGDAIPWSGSDGAPSIVANLNTATGQGVLYDAAGTQRFSDALFELIASKHQVHGADHRLLASTTEWFHRLRGSDLSDVPESSPKASVPHAGHSAAAIIYDDQLMLKLFRRLDEAVSPDLELRRLLTLAGFPQTPSLAGCLEIQLNEPDSHTASEPWTFAILQEFVRPEGSSWNWAADATARYIEQLLANPMQPPESVACATTASLMAGLRSQISATTHEQTNAYSEMVELLARRTAQMHLALASVPAGEATAPEPLTSFHRRSLYQRMRSNTVRVFRSLQKHLDERLEETPDIVREVTALKPVLLARFAQLNTARIVAARIRCHGDYHLGNVIYTGKDFYVVNFEGSLDLSLGGRRTKRSPLRDVAEMLHCFAEVCQAVAAAQIESGVVLKEHSSHLQTATCQWLVENSARFLRAYFDSAERASFIPDRLEHVLLLLDVFRLERAVEQIGSDLSHRPEHLRWSCEHLLCITESL